MMKRSMKWLLPALALSAVPAAAHHSYSMFDMNKTVALEATVSRFKWQNPHSFIEADVQAPGGSERWAIEMTAPANLVQEGRKRSSLKPGDNVTIWVHRSSRVNTSRSARHGSPRRGRTMASCREIAPTAARRACRGSCAWRSTRMSSSSPPAG